MKKFTIASLIIVGLAVCSMANAAQDQLIVEQVRKSHLAHEQPKTAEHDHDSHAEATATNDQKQIQGAQEANTRLTGTDTSSQDSSNK
ncbi:hypothetical protein [Glaciimonas sp. PCH181]|uniref:hypothetical protein n=1 Tax=Glaciimonas sp. PCH181 TaxID=2133943 RepID=UPI000D3CC47E|nr:hypothetical protein [Glaciimonas sp. PCH181]PUA19328.1 hypothetical protein C7W93_05495 [Glaciimonas sp. PCH181]